MTATSPTPETPATPPAPATASAAALHAPVIEWFDTHARDLPWRRPEAGAWG